MCVFPCQGPSPGQSPRSASSLTHGLSALLAESRRLERVDVTGNHLSPAQVCQAWSVCAGRLCPLQPGSRASSAAGPRVTLFWANRPVALCPWAARLPSGELLSGSVTFPCFYTLVTWVWSMGFLLPLQLRSRRKRISNHSANSF